MLNKKQNYIENEVITVRNLIGQVIEKVAELEELDSLRQEYLVKKVIKDANIKKYLGKQLSKSKPVGKLDYTPRGHISKYIKYLKENKLAYPKMNKLETRILECISEFKHLEVAMLRSPSRERAYVDARIMCYYIFREILGYIYAKVGLIFLRDHSTIIHGLETHESLMSTDQKYRNDFYYIMDKLVEEFPKDFYSYDAKMLKDRYGNKKRSV